MKVRDLLLELLKVKDLDTPVVIHSVDVNPYNGMHELREAGPAVGAYEGGGGFVVVAEMIDPEEWENEE